jgi:hypothetical protein
MVNGSREEPEPQGLESILFSAPALIGACECRQVGSKINKRWDRAVEGVRS